MAVPRRTRSRTPGVCFDREPSAAQRVEWMLQRGTRFIFAAIVAAALLGLFGQGLLSGAVAESAGVRATFERFVRDQAEVVLEAVPSGAELSLRVHGIVESSAVLVASPAPLRQRITDEGRELTFAATPGERSFVTLRWKPAAAGAHRGSISTGDARIDLWFFVYP